MISLFALALLCSSTASAGCSSEDASKWVASGFSDQVVEFSTRSSTTKSLVKLSLTGKESVTIKQISEKAVIYLGLSPFCSDCLAKNIVCAYKHCAGDCMSDPNSSKCRKCNDLHCTAAFRECVGPEAVANMLNFSSDEN